MLNLVEKMTTMHVTTNGESMEYELRETKMQNNLSEKHSIVESSKTKWKKEIQGDKCLGTFLKIHHGKESQVWVPTNKTILDTHLQ